MNAREPMPEMLFLIFLSKKRKKERKQIRAGITFLFTKRSKRKIKIASMMVIRPIPQHKGYKRFYNYVSNVEHLNTNNNFLKP